MNEYRITDISAGQQERFSVTVTEETVTVSPAARLARVTVGVERVSRGLSEARERVTPVASAVPRLATARVSGTVEPASRVPAGVTATTTGQGPDEGVTLRGWKAVRYC